MSELALIMAFNTHQSVAIHFVVLKAPVTKACLYLDTSLWRRRPFVRQRFPLQPFTPFDSRWFLGLHLTGHKHRSRNGFVLPFFSPIYSSHGSSLNRHHRMNSNATVQTAPQYFSMAFYKGASRTPRGPLSGCVWKRLAFGATCVYHFPNSIVRGRRHFQDRKVAILINKNHFLCRTFSVDIPSRLSQTRHPFCVLN